MNTETLTEPLDLKEEILTQQTTAYSIATFGGMVALVCALLAFFLQNDVVQILFGIAAAIATVFALMGLGMMQEETIALFKKRVLSDALLEKVETAQAALVPTYREPINYFMARQGSASEEFAREWELLIRRIAATETTLANLVDPEGKVVKEILVPGKKDKERNALIATQRTLLQQELDKARELALHLANFEDRLTVRMLDRTL